MHRRAVRGAQVCVECGEAVSSTIQEVRASSTSIRLRRCDSCGQIADKYVEFETLLVLLDVLLHRVSAYRHLLCNCTHHSAQDSRRGALIRGTLVLLLCEPSLKAMTAHTAARDLCPEGNLTTLEMPPQAGAAPPSWAVVVHITLPIAFALVRFLVFCTVIVVVSHPLLKSEQHRQHCTWRSIATCVLLSSLGKAFNVLPAIWDYGALRFVFAQATELFVLACNCVALKVQLRCHTRTSVLVICAAATTRFAVECCLEGLLRPSLAHVWSGSNHVASFGSSANCTELFCGACSGLGMRRTG
ncbi:hypothetical protein AB1Y20_019079 [Prymnesium parvum]|uniref:Protein ARV n=1 Tax=Prymnesium parvum TaxID=97485 RepID=A0AB34JTY9_PRYPA